MNPQEILDALDFQTICNFGHPNEYGHPANKPCPRPAVWSVNYHACPQSSTGTPGTGTAIWCNHHLKIFQVGVETQFDDNPGIQMGCACGHLYNTPSDFFWGATPLNKQNTNPPKENES